MFRFRFSSHGEYEQVLGIVLLTRRNVWGVGFAKVADRELDRPPTRGGLPNEGSEYIPEVRNYGFRHCCINLFLKGVFGHTVPPKGRPRPPQPFTGGFPLITCLDPLPS